MTATDATAPASPQSKTAKTRSRREQRRIDRAATKLHAYLEAQPLLDIYPHLTAAQLTAATGLTINELSPALRAEGWRRDQVRIASTPTILWTPPGYPSPLRERGRPRKVQPLSMQSSRTALAPVERADEEVLLRTDANQQPRHGSAVPADDLELLDDLLGRSFGSA